MVEITLDPDNNFCVCPINHLKESATMNQQSSATAGMACIATRTVRTVLAQTLPYYSQRRSSWAKQIIGGVALTSLSLSLLAGGEAEAVSFTFEKIVDTSTPIPGGTSTFKGFDFVELSLDNGDMAFAAGNDQKGIGGVYTSIAGELNVVADMNTSIPGGTTTFEVVGSPSLDDGNVAFSGGGLLNEYFYFEEQGIYTNIGGKLNVVADTNTPVPGDISTFADSSYSPSLDDGNVAFTGVGSNGDVNGVYTSIDGELDVVADANTTVPGGKNTFERVRFPSLDDGNVAFEGESFGESGFQYGIYTNIGGTLNVIADRNTPIPGGTGTFEYLNSPSLSDESVAFSGGIFDQDTSGRNVPVGRGIYTSTGGVLNVIADTSTPIPDGTGIFEAFTTPSLDNGSVAFLGYEGLLDPDALEYEQRGIYTNLDSVLVEVIAKGDILDGKTVDDLVFDSEGLSGNQIAFTAVFEDDSQGIYIATVPEPSSVLGTLVFGAFGGGWMLKRKLRKAKISKVS